MEQGDVVITTGGKQYRVTGVFGESIKMRSINECIGVQEVMVRRDLVVECGSVYRRVM